MPVTLNFFNGKSQLLSDSFELEARNALKHTCNEASFYIFSDFPVAISAETDVKLIICGCIKKVPRNYYRSSKSNDTFYIDNFIIPVTVINAINKNVTIDSFGECVIDGAPVDVDGEVQQIKTQVKNYLVQKCNFSAMDLIIAPLIFIKTDSLNHINNRQIIAPAIDWRSLIIHLGQSFPSRVQTNRQWTTEHGYSQFDLAMQVINIQASRDAATGYITKEKIARLTSSLFEEKNEQRRSRRGGNQQSNMFGEEQMRQLEIELNADSLEEDVLEIISGKAGSGKTAILLQEMLTRLKNNEYTKLLTYNHLLVHDFVRTVKTITNAIATVPQSSIQFAGASVMTLHAFFFRLALRLGILTLMKKDRIVELMSKLDQRTEKALLRIGTLTSTDGSELFKGNVYENLKNAYLRSSTDGLEEKEVVIDFINFVKKRNASVTIDLPHQSIVFQKHKRLLIEQTATQQIFFADYYNVLKMLKLACTNPDAIYDRFDVRNEYHLLYSIMNFDKHYSDNPDVRNGIIPRDVYLSRVNRSLGQTRRPSKVFVDEGQDCHELEKEILFEIFEPKRIMVATGGMEQMIRHKNICEWRSRNHQGIAHRETKLKKRLGSRKTLPTYVIF